MCTVFSKYKCVPKSAKNFTCLPRVAGPVSSVRGGALVVGEADHGEQAQN